MLMKKSLFQQLLFGFFLFGAMAFATSASAQALNWKTEQQALQVLKGEVAKYDVALQGTPGTTDYNNALKHAVYFKAIMILISNGTATSVAAQQALSDAAGALNDPLASNVPAGPKTGEVALYDEAVDLLTD
jgi:hypothetical protein